MGVTYKGYEIRIIPIIRNNKHGIGIISVEYEIHQMAQATRRADSLVIGPIQFFTVLYYECAPAFLAAAEEAARAFIDSMLLN